MTVPIGAKRRPHRRASRALLTAIAVAAGLLSWPTTAAAVGEAPPAGHGTVELTLTDGATGAPVEGVSVSVDPVEYDPSWEWVTGETDASGVVSLHVPAGAYRVSTNPHLDQYVPAYYPGVALYADAERVTVTQGQTLALAMQMMAPASAVLSVSGDGQPVPGVRVTMYRIAADGSELPGGDCTTDATGRCEISRLRAGDYRAFASPPWQDHAQWVTDVWPARGETVRIESGQRAEAAIALPAATRITGDVRLDFTHPTERVTLWVSAAYVGPDGVEPGHQTRVSGAPGQTVPFALDLEAGRPFRLVLEGFDTAGDRYDRLIATEEWTSTGMALLGETVTVAEDQTRHFELDAHVGATIAGTLRVREGVGGAVDGIAATQPSAEQLERIERHSESVQAADQSADFGCGGSCGMVIVDLYQLRSDGWRYLEMVYAADEALLGVEQRFSFTGLAPGTYRLGFWGDHVCHEFWQDRTEFDDATYFEVTPQGNAVVIAAELQTTSGDCSNAGPRELPTPDRISGGDRFATAVAISKRAFPTTASVVYLASGMNYPDGLAAGPAAAHQGGPVLLTRPDAVPQSVLDEIERLQPEQVVIVGGTPSVWAQAEQQVRDLDPERQVIRIGGADRFETSRLLAEHAFEGAGSAFLATGMKFPDALTAGPAAAMLGGPVLLVNGGQATPDAGTRATLDALGVSWVGVAGDPQSVSVGFEEGLMSAGFDVERFSGRDRFATAAQIGMLFAGASTVVVASGEGFADALPGAAAAGAVGAPMLLARSGCVPVSTSSALDRWMPTDVWLLGGEPTLSPSVASYTACR
ncbi:cell wall-binding repeat-containing protein [Agrococcus sp. DT81.2]|uniref:cell wall-binding repeat-containing protein n=1 Tax=Agrococcus sp. DT81.2 TaxID=3393414 RepID=UPI003CE47756